jgi:hypothetical protein
MLREGRDVLFLLCNIDKEYTYVSRWFNLCFTRFDIFGERLSLYDIVVEDEVTQTMVGAGSNCAIDEPRSSSKRHRPIQIDMLCCYILGFQLLKCCII